MFTLKKKDECFFDEISLGEVMLRFDPSDTRIRTARSFRVWEGGGEYNVARGLAKCFKQKTAVLTGLPLNEAGYLVSDLINQGNVETEYIKWYPYDGIGKNSRVGLNFTERGFGVRGAIGVSDRANTAASALKPEDIDFTDIFFKKGVRMLHTGGVYAALSDDSAKTALYAVTEAKKYGVVVSYDLNYRPSLWQYNGGKEKAREINSRIAEHVDILIGNEEDYNACLGIGSDSGLSCLDLENYKKMLKTAAKTYPGVSVLAVTLRTVKSASVNGWTAMCLFKDRIYEAMVFEELEIYDRVGGGDSFASGFLYGFLEDMSVQDALNCGVCHGALAMTTPGDTSMASKEEVFNLMKGAGQRVRR